MAPLPDVQPEAAAVRPAGLHGRPRLQRDVLTRHRLIRRLDDPFALTHVHGPAGSGKTVLLADWARRADAGRGAWVTVDETRRFRTPFWIHVAETLADAGLVRADHVLASAAEAMGATRDLRDLLVRGMRQLGQTTLVIDNAGLLDDETATDLVEVLCAVPGLRVVTASRNARVRAFAQARIRLDVQSIGPQDLALTPEETGELGGVSGDEQDRLFHLSGGLPLVVRAHLLEAESSGEDALEQHVYAMTDTLDEDLQRFVRGTVVADSLTPELADALAGGSGSGVRREGEAAGGDRPCATVHLDAIEDRGLGMWSEDGSTFAYTTALRLALRSRLRREEPRTYAALRRRVAQQALATGRPFEALQIGAELDDLDLVDSAVRAGFVTLGMTHAQGVREVLGHLSLVRLRGRPVIALMLALVYNAQASTRAKAMSLFTLAIVSSRARGRRMDLTDRIGLRSIENGALRVTGRPSRRVAASIEQMLAEMPDAVRDELRENLPMIYAQLGITWLYVGEVDRALAGFENALAAAAGIGRPSAALHSLALLGGTHALSGDLVSAAEYTGRARAVRWPDGWVTDYPGTYYQLGESLLALERLDLEAARTHLELLEPEVPTTEHWAALAYVQAWADLASGRAEAGLIRLDEVARHHRRRSGATAAGDTLVERMRVMLCVASGRAPRAADAVELPAGADQLHALRAWVHLLTGRDDKALEHLARAPRAGGQTPRERAEQAGVLTAALLRTGDDDAAGVALTRYAALLDAYRMRLPLLLLPGADRAAMLALAERTGDATARRVLTDVVLPDVFEASDPPPALTPREAIVLRELVQSSSAHEIAARLQVSTNTVRSQTRTLYRKLGASSRQEALVAAGRYGLL